jgi:hypothetical protein
VVFGDGALAVSAARVKDDPFILADKRVRVVGVVRCDERDPVPACRYALPGQQLEPHAVALAEITSELAWPVVVVEVDLGEIFEAELQQGRDGAAETLVRVALQAADEAHGLCGLGGFGVTIGGAGRGDVTIGGGVLIGAH